MAKVRRRSDMDEYRALGAPAGRPRIDVLRRRGVRLDVAELDQRLDRAPDDLVRNGELAAERLQLADVVVVGLRRDRRIELGFAGQDRDRLVAVGRVVQPVHGGGQRTQIAARRVGIVAQPLRPRQHGQEAVLLAEGADVEELAVALGFGAEIERLRQQRGLHRAARPAPPAGSAWRRHRSARRRRASCPSRSASGSRRWSAGPSGTAG